MGNNSNVFECTPIDELGIIFFVRYMQLNNAYVL